MALAVGATEISTEIPQELWHSALETLERSMPESMYQSFVKQLRPISLQGNELTLSVPSPLSREWMETRLRAQVTDLLSEIFGERLTLRFIVVEPPQSEGSTPLPSGSPFAPPPVVRAGDENRGGNLNARYTFEEFVIGNSNRFAHAAAKAVASSPANAYNPLFLYGGVGLGKTHLMHAIGHRVMLDNPNARVVYVTCEKFTNEFIMAVQNNKGNEFRNKYRLVDVLLIDDIQFLEGKEGTQEEFFHTFNALHESKRQLVISSDRPPKEIQTLEARLRSRFEWGLLTDIQPPDLETREAILRKKAESEKIPVPDDVTSFIAKVIPSNIRELEGALIRVVAFASLTKSPIAVELAAEVLKSAIVHMPPRRVTIGKIKEVVANAHGLTVKEMDNGRRDQRLAAPRQIAMYIATELTDYSLPNIAREFGKKDHTTVMYARDKVKDQFEADEVFRNRIKQFMSLCQSV